MQRIAGANTVLIAPGKNGFQDQNTAAGIAGTQVTAAFMTALQEELCAIVEGTGVALNPSVNNQVLSALIAALAPSPVYLTSAGTGTITAPAWATRLEVRAWGGGNQGGAGGPTAASGNGGGGGGGAGGYIEGVIGGITGGDDYTWQVGNGGGLAGPTSLGTSLRDTSSVALVACSPGGAGTAGTATTVGIGGAGGAAAGPAGGSYTFSGLARPGMGGSNGDFFATNLATGGPGGSAWGGSITQAAVTAGDPADGPGNGGAGGGAGGYAGGAGGVGAMILRWLP